VWTWKFSARDPHAPDATSKLDDDLSSVLNDLDSLKVVLIDGRFQSATGFTLSDDNRVATIIANDHSAPNGADDSTMVLELNWVSATTQ
jgi:hypothetical protein